MGVLASLCCSSRLDGVLNSHLARRHLGSLYTVRPLIVTSRWRLIVNFWRHRSLGSLGYWQPIVCF